MQCEHCDGSNILNHQYFSNWISCNPPYKFAYLLVVGDIGTIMITDKNIFNYWHTFKKEKKTWQSLELGESNKDLTYF